MYITPRKRLMSEPQEDWLWYLTNKLGQEELWLCQNYIREEQMMFSKWITFQTLQSYDYHEVVLEQLPFVTRPKQFIEQATHRRILDIEILLDIDDVYHPHFIFDSILTKAKVICMQLKEKGIPYIVYWTGSKSYHISYYDLRLRDLTERQRTVHKIKILESYGADLMKSTPKAMIALEGAKHYKSGKAKKCVDLI